jgi:hypothetical protein
MSQSNRVSAEHQHFSGRYFQNEGAKPMKQGVDYSMDSMESVEALMGALGIGCNESVIRYAMDTIQQPATTPSIATPIQFLQEWLPGIVEVITAKQAIDDIVGRTTVGSWEDEQIVQQVIALTGAATPYSDLGNVPLSNWNQTFVTRTVVRFELGMRVGILEEKRSARVRVDSAGQKRRSDAIQLEIQRNAVGFYGYNSGNGQTYGYLNDPNLPSYVNNPGPAWASATFLEIQTDLLTIFQTLRTQSKGRIDPSKQPITLALPTACVDYLAVTSTFGNSVWDWLKGYYSNVRIVDAPQLNGANGGANVMIVHADTVLDSGTDDQKTFTQVVPATFQLLGMQQQVKGYEEDYSNATAGVLCKRPYAVVRMSGI